MSRWSNLADSVLEATIVGSFTTAGFKARRTLSDWPALPPMHGSNVLVTGGTSGIGRATARSLCELGADVMITSRSIERAEQAAADIESEISESEISESEISESEISNEGSVIGAALDTSDFESIHELVDRVSAVFGSLDVLINNAGALTDERRENDEGMELTLASHLVGPYQLMQELRSLMPTGSRVLWMSSGGMYTQGLDVADLEMGESSYRGAIAYARAKRAQVEMVHHLGPQWAPGIIMHAMHPGWVDTDGVDQGLPGFSRVMGPLLRSAEEGADTMVWLATGGGDDATPGSFFLDREPRRTVYLPGTGTDETERQALIDWLDLVTLPSRNSSAQNR